MLVEGRGCWGWVVIAMGLMAGRGGGGGCWVKFDCAETEGKRFGRGVESHAPSGKQPLELVQKLLGNWDVCLLLCVCLCVCAELPLTHNRLIG